MAQIPKTSRAAVIVEYGKPLHIREYPIPEVEPGGILVRNEMAGVCGTDVHLWRGAFAAPGMPVLVAIPGHEFASRIVEMGREVTHDSAGEPLKVGDRIMWPHVECGRCYWCRIVMQPNLCIRRTLYGFRSSEEYPHLMGGFAEYIYVIPGAQVVKIPEELTNEEVIGACCAFRTAVAAFERLGGMEVQANVVIQGAGPIGLYSLLLYREGGAGKVIVVGAPRNRLELALKWGADHVIDIGEVPDASERATQIRSWTQGLGPDVVVEASGGPTAFLEGLEMVRSGGKYVIIGQTKLDVENTIKPALIVIKHLDIRGSVSAVVAHYYRALRFIKNNRQKYSFADIVTSKHSLDRATEALEAMESGQGIKPVVLP